MGTVIGTCCHEIEMDWWISGNGDVAYKERCNDYENERIVNAVAYGLVCENCKKNYEEWGILLHSKEEEELWLEDKIPYDNDEDMHKHMMRWTAS